MSETRTIRALSSTGSLSTLTVQLTNSPPWKLVACGLGFHNREFEGADLFEALVELRRELERIGYQVLCVGARVDAFPSSMSRSMGGGRKVYIARLGEPATATADICDEAESGAVGTIEQQKEFHNKWIHSLMKRK